MVGRNNGGISENPPNFDPTLFRPHISKFDEMLQIKQIFIIIVKKYVFNINYKSNSSSSWDWSSSRCSCCPVYSQEYASVSSRFILQPKFPVDVNVNSNLTSSPPLGIGDRLAFMSITLPDILFKSGIKSVGGPRAVRHCVFFLGM